MSARIKHLRQEKADVVRDARALVDKATTENRDLNDEERAKRTAAFSRLEVLGQEIADEERLMDVERTLGSVPDQAQPPAADAAARQARKADGDFASFGERMQAVAAAAGPQARVDPRLVAGPTGLNESRPSEGGFLVGQDQVADVRQRMYSEGEILSRVFKLPVSAGSNGIKLMAIDETSRANGSRFGGITSYWLEEAGLKTPSKPSFRPMSLNLKKVAAMVYATDELLQDAPALEAWIMRYLPQELRFVAEDAIISGTGSGMPLGILNSGAAVTVARETPGTVTYQDIKNMWSRFWAPSRGASGAAWFIDQSAEPALFSMYQEVGVGGVPVYLPANGISGKPYSSLFGIPVFPVEYLSAVGTKGDVLLADLSQYTLIDKGGVQSASSIHVRFQYDETAFRFVYRVDGQPEWTAPLTPKNLGPTLSPFVVLAT